MPVALITGCSSGFGVATAHQFARNGYEVYATVRRDTDAQRLSQAADSGLHTLLLAVRDRDAIARTVKEIHASTGRSH